jgi:hypothetical protein
MWAMDESDGHRTLLSDAEEESRLLGSVARLSNSRSSEASGGEEGGGWCDRRQKCRLTGVPKGGQPGQAWQVM